MKTHTNNIIVIKTLILFTCCIFLFSTVKAEITDEFITEKVSFRNGETKLAGTLSLPSMDGLHPAVVLISGSGPQNRDGETKAIPG